MLHLAQWAIGKDLEAFKSKMNTSPGRTGYFKIAFNYKFTTASNQELISYLEGRVKLPDGECSFIFMSNECISASLLSYNYFPAELMVYFCDRNCRFVEKGKKYLNDKITISYTCAKPGFAAGFFISSSLL